MDPGEDGDWAAYSWHARVHGRVQGVGFRDACVDAARAIGVTGWVRNRRDGSVEAMLQGPPQALQRMREWLRRGEPPARVDCVEVEPAAGPVPRYAAFERLPSA
jgi:acylphosphatase